MRTSTVGWEREFILCFITRVVKHHLGEAQGKGNAAAAGRSFE